MSRSYVDNSVYILESRKGCSTHYSWIWKEIVTVRNLPGGGHPASKADNLTAICEPIVKII
jgi:hypothetical protein